MPVGEDFLMAPRCGIARVATTAVVVFMVLVSGVIGYEYGVLSSGQRSSSQLSVSTTQSPPSNVESAATVISLKTTTLISNSTALRTITENGGYVTNVTQTVFQTNLVSENNSISDLLVSNIALPGFADASAVNTKTNVVYVEYSAADYTGLAVINGNTDSLITTISLGNATTIMTPVVNQDTGAVYIGNAIINGTTDQISSYYNQSLTFIAADPRIDAVYAMNTTWNGYNGTTTIFQINGTTNAVESTLRFFGNPEAGDNPITINSETGVLYFIV
jgi:hypothetical protein